THRGVEHAERMPTLVTTRKSRESEDDVGLLGGSFEHRDTARERDSPTAAPRRHRPRSTVVEHAGRFESLAYLADDRFVVDVARDRDHHGFGAVSTLVVIDDLP